MTLAELISLGKSKGYAYFYDGSKHYPLDEYLTIGPDRNYSLLDTGTVTYYEDGMTWFNRCRLTISANTKNPRSI